jgi:hypothetical protein
MAGERGSVAAATTAVYTLTRVLHAISYPPLLAAVTGALVGTRAAAVRSTLTYCDEKDDIRV